MQAVHSLVGVCRSWHSGSGRVRAMCTSSCTRTQPPSVRRWNRSGISVKSSHSRLSSVLCHFCTVLCCAVALHDPRHAEVIECHGVGMPVCAVRLFSMLARLCVCVFVLCSAVFTNTPLCYPRNAMLSMLYYAGLYSSGSMLCQTVPQVCFARLSWIVPC